MLALRFILILSLSLCAKTVSVVAAEEEPDSLRLAMRDIVKNGIAKEFRKIIAANGKKEITIKEPGYTSSKSSAKCMPTGGHALKIYLRNELERADFKIVEDGDVTVKGEYYFYHLDEGPDSKVGVRIYTELIDKKKNQRIGDRFVRTVTDNGPDVVAKIFNAPAHVDSDLALLKKVQPEEVVVQAAVAGVMEPKTFVDRSKVAARENSKYWVEVLVGKDKNSLKPAKANNRSGLPYVLMEPDDTYAVMIHNDTDEEVAVQLCIDGLSMFAYQNESEKKPTFVVIRKKSCFTVPGWYRDKHYSYTFKVRETDPNAPSDLRESPGQLSTIFVSFHRCWAGNAPKDEPLYAKASGTLETVKGALIKAEYEMETKTVGVMREAVSIRYERP
jgi:hypothetical protein